MLAWTPAETLVAEWKPDGCSTRLEIRFECPAPRATNVILVHEGFEAYGERATRMRDMHDTV